MGEFSAKSVLKNFHLSGLAELQLSFLHFDIIAKPRGAAVCVCVCNALHFLL